MLTTNCYPNSRAFVIGSPQNIQYLSHFEGLNHIYIGHCYSSSFFFISLHNRNITLF